MIPGCESAGFNYAEALEDLASVCTCPTDQEIEKRYVTDVRSAISRWALDLRLDLSAEQWQKLGDAVRGAVGLPVPDRRPLAPVKRLRD